MADFTAIWGAGLVPNERVLSTELNQLDADHVNSLNKSGGTITGPITLNAASSLIFDSGSTINGIATIPNTTVFTIAAAGSGAFDITSALNVTGFATFQDNVTFKFGNYLIYNGSLQIGDGTAASDATVANLSILEVLSGGTFQTDAGSTTTLNGPINMGGIAFHVASGGLMDFQSGSELLAGPGSAVIIDGTLTVGSAATSTFLGTVTAGTVVVAASGTLDMNATATALLNGPVVSTAGISGSSGSPLLFAESSGIPSVPLSSGATVVLSAAQQASPCIKLTGSLSTTSYLDLGAAPAGAVFFLNLLNVGTAKNLVIQNGGGTGSQILANTTSGCVAICFSTTTVAVTGT